MTVAPTIRPRPPSSNESWSRNQEKTAGSSETTSSGRTKTRMRRRRSPLPILRRRYAQTATTAKASAAARPALRSGVRSIGSARRLRERSGPPLRDRINHVHQNAILVAADDLEHRLDQRLGEHRRLEAEREELGVSRVVVVLLHLETGVRDVVDLHLDPELAARVTDLLREIRDVERLRELVEDAVFPGRGRVRRRELDALEGVHDVEESTGLTALAVHGQRVADHGLYGEAVEGGPEQLVVVETGEETLVEPGLRRLDAVDDALVQVGRPKPPHPAGEVDVVAVVDLGEVVERAGQLREGQGVSPALVLDLDEPLLDVDVGRSVLAHRPELDEMRLGRVLAHRPEELQRADDVVPLRHDRVVDALHRPGSARLLPVVHDRVRLEVGDDVLHERALGNVADVRVDPLSRHFAPGVDALVEP